MTPPAGRVHREFAVTRETARQMARVAVRYRMTSASFLVPLATLALGGLLCAGTVLWPLAGMAAVVIVTMLGAPFVRMGRLATTLQAHGFAPGTTIAVDYDETAFTVTTSVGTSLHEYAQVRRLRYLLGGAGIRIVPGSYLLVLPAALVPAEVRERLRPSAPPVGPEPTLP
ncbi:hypothetical protein SAMN05443575_4267 [Jatrophihabitans endophyticus]|uniref:Uncharacterized protein n=1 Tax=Jatrophihabitans endophyticus TaxID=1206085 RepID=A0A1M5UPT7_9ACTN|nr:hypothetical protein [Jatrophihabitans endophyticus]SHH64858.1 hypothetical protein SAMN05443575_4267 [Jatrophihabitans endophyticus]